MIHFYGADGRNEILPRPCRQPRQMSEFRRSENDSYTYSEWLEDWNKWIKGNNIDWSKPSKGNNTEQDQQAKQMIVRIPIETRISENDPHTYSEWLEDWSKWSKGNNTKQDHHAKPKIKPRNTNAKDENPFTLNNHAKKRGKKYAKKASVLGNAFQSGAAANPFQHKSESEEICCFTAKEPHWILSLNAT